MTEHKSTEKYRDWLRRNLHSLDVDVVGQINFVGTKYEHDQEARVAIQSMFDQESYCGGEDTFTQEDEHTDMLEKEVIKELNTYTIKVTETKKGNSIKLDIETEGKATPTIKAHILELLLEEMVLGKFRSHDYDKELLERFVSYLREMHRVGFNYPVVDEFIESELKNE